MYAYIYIYIVYIEAICDNIYLLNLNIYSYRFKFGFFVFYFLPFVKGKMFYFIVEICTFGTTLTLDYFIFTNVHKYFDCISLINIK